jgi:hypothetical protein
VYALILLQGFRQIYLETRRKTQLMHKFLTNSKKKHEETLSYQAYSTKITKNKHPRDSALTSFTKIQVLASTREIQESDREKCPSRAKISALQYVILK